jgi:hypothetical protein
MDETQSLLVKERYFKCVIDCIAVPGVERQVAVGEPQKVGIFRDNKVVRGRDEEGITLAQDGTASLHGTLAGGSPAYLSDDPILQAVLKSEN